MLVEWIPPLGVADLRRSGGTRRRGAGGAGRGSEGCGRGRGGAARDAVTKHDGPSAGERQIHRCKGDQRAGKLARRRSGRPVDTNSERGPEWAGRSGAALHTALQLCDLSTAARTDPAHPGHPGAPRTALQRVCPKLGRPISITALGYSRMVIYSELIPTSRLQVVPHTWLRVVVKMAGRQGPRSRF